MLLKRVVTVVQAFTILVAALAVVLLVVRQPPEVPSTARASAAGAPAAAPDGRAVYLAQCAACHGESGEGTYAPALKGGAAAQRFPNVADQIAVVTGGVAGTPMKAFATKLTPEEIEAVVAYTRSL